MGTIISSYLPTLQKALGIPKAYQFKPDENSYFQVLNLPDNGFSVSSIFGYLTESLGLDELTDFIPEDLLKGASCRLLAFGITMDADALSETEFFFRFTLPGGDWEIIPDILTIKDVQVEVMGAGLPVPGDVQLRVTGHFVFGGTSFFTTFNPTRGEISSTLESGTPSFKPMLERFHLSGTPLDQVTLMAMGLSANYKEKSWSVGLTLKTNWELDVPKLSLYSVSGILSYTSDPNDFTAGINACCSIAKVPIELSALYTNHSWDFEGHIIEGNTIKIGDFVDDITKTVFPGLKTTLPNGIAKNLEISNLKIAFNTLTKNFSFAGSIKGFKVTDNVTMTLDLKADITHPQPGKTEMTFSGKLKGGGLEFDVIFDKGENGKIILAQYVDSRGGGLSISKLVGAFDPSVGAQLNGLNFSIKNVLLAINKKQKKSSILFCINVDAGINLSGMGTLPLVGDYLSDIALSAQIRLLYANNTFSQADVAKLSSLAEGHAKLPATAINKGVHVVAEVHFAGVQIPFDLPVKPKGGSNQLAAPAKGVQGPAGNPITADPDVKWIDVNRHFGPLSVDRLGLKFKAGKLGVYFDGDLSAFGLTMALLGLGVDGIPITGGALSNGFTPEFHLQGLGLTYKNPTLEVGGIFLNNGNGFDGMATLKMKKLSMMALGSYSKVNGHPSLFIYALLNYPIGGPSFFFVTGLAAGFGFNRRMRRVSLDDMGTFPLVSEAIKASEGNSPQMSTKDKANKLSSELATMHKYIQPETGAYFLALGLKFTSFELISTFALLVGQLHGNKFELDLLGMSNLVIPTPIPGGNSSIHPLVVAEFAFSAHISPMDGEIAAAGQLTKKSHVLDPGAHLSGGFAYGAWFGGPNQGDFVYSVGGYHPNFKIPDHYPRVKALGLNWHLSNNFNISGHLYYAITPHVAMAGGGLNAHWSSGPLDAYFGVGADFLISWKPFHYDISAWLNIHVTFTYSFFGTHHISMSLNAGLHLHGPNFSGSADISFKVAFIHVHKHLDFGSNKTGNAPISFDEFKKSFLPASPETKILSATCHQGLIREVEVRGKKWWIVKAKSMHIATDSAIPVTKVSGHFVALRNTDFGIHPMGKEQKDISSELTVSIQYAGETNVYKKIDNFKVTPVYKNVPAALWHSTGLKGGNVPTLDLHQESMIKNVLTGIEITPSAPPKAGESAVIERKHLSYEILALDKVIEWPSLAKFNSSSLNWQHVQADMISNWADDKMDLFKDMGISEPEFFIGETLGTYNLAPPTVCS